MTDRLLTINIRKYLVTQPRNKRARKMARYLRDRVAHYTKTDIANVRLSQELNTLILKYYAKRMVPVKLNIKIENQIATAIPLFHLPSQKAQPQPQAAKKDEKPAKKPLIEKVTPKPEAKPQHPQPAQQKPGAPAKPATTK